MEDEVGGLLFSSNVNNASQQFSVSTVSLPYLSPEEESRIDTVSAANNLLENGILVETNKGLVCLSLKDALTSGVGGLNLSVEDFQNVAAQLLIQQNVDKSASDRVLPTFTTEDIMLNVLPDVPQNKGVHSDSSMCKTDLNRMIETYKPEEALKETFKQEVEHLEEEEIFLPLQVDIIENELKEGRANTVTQVAVPQSASVVAKAPTLLKREQTEQSTPVVTPTTVTVVATTSASTVTTSSQQKKRGGWPKGRKRKPELSEMRPPKAPATGYVLYLNEKRKQYKDLPFPEVTKLLGNEWSKLSLEDKRVYLERAEIEKKRYREELKAYRQSDAYQSYLNKKRMKNLQGNGTEESDMDATDEIEDEDNEELYCRTCDQWFSSLHNKKEHLYGRQHLQSIAGDFTKERLAEQDSSLLGVTGSHSVSTSLDESSLDGAPVGRAGKSKQEASSGPTNVTDAITRFYETAAERECEIRLLSRRMKEMQGENAALWKELERLKEQEVKLKADMEHEKDKELLIEQQLYNLWAVPTMFFINTDLEAEAGETVLICFPETS